MTWIEQEAHRKDGLAELRSLSKERLGELLHLALTDDLRRKPWKGHKNPIAGHCYVASEVIHYLFPYLRPHFVECEGQPHWYLVCPEDTRIKDPGEFVASVPFSAAFFYPNNRSTSWTDSPLYQRLLICDPTRSQFKDTPDYLSGIGKGFLTREPSKRALIVLDRMMLAAMVGV